MSITSKINNNTEKLNNINEGLFKVKSIIRPIEEINMNQNISTSGVTALPSDVVSGKKFIDYNGSLKTGSHVCQATPTLQNKSVVPTKTTQYVRPDSGYDGMSEVIVNPIPANYVSPTGNLDILRNGLYNIAMYDSVTVNVDNASSLTVTFDSGNKILNIRR